MIVVENATQNITDASLMVVDDMITLSEMHEAVILHNLKVKFDADLIYVCIHTAFIHCFCLSLCISELLALFFRIYSYL